MADVDRPIELQRDADVPFPDGLEVRLLGGGHKRPRVGGPQCGFSTLLVKQGDAVESFRLNHVSPPDGTETWGQQRWNRYLIELRHLAPDESSTIVVRKP